VSQGTTSDAGGGGMAVARGLGAEVKAALRWRGEER
jgi:hypothetical protein